MYQNIYEPSTLVLCFVEGTTVEDLSEIVAAVVPRNSGHEGEYSDPGVTCYHTEVDGNKNDGTTTGTDQTILGYGHFARFCIANF